VAAAGPPDGDAGGAADGGDGGVDRLLAELGASLGAQIVTVVPDWVERQIHRIVDAWDPTATAVDRRALATEAERAGRRAAEDVAGRLGPLLAADVDAQATTPLAVVRAAVSYPTAVLRSVGVPGVVRDAFDEDRFPDDVYGLTPASLAALDPELADPARAWGAAKAMAHRARHGAAPG
jgi:hypothetical protein